MLDLTCHFRRFIDAEPGRVHLAAHSHHYWPDVTFDAQILCWEEAAATRTKNGKRSSPR